MRQGGFVPSLVSLLQTSLAPAFRSECSLRQLACNLNVSSLSAGVGLGLCKLSGALQAKTNMRLESDVHVIDIKLRLHNSC